MEYENSINSGSALDRTSFLRRLYSHLALVSLCLFASSCTELNSSVKSQREIETTVKSQRIIDSHSGKKYLQLNIINTPINGMKSPLVKWELTTCDGKVISPLEGPQWFSAFLASVHDQEVWVESCQTNFLSIRKGEECVLLFDLTCFKSLNAFYK